jgi:hypothetical protein
VLKLQCRPLHKYGNFGDFAHVHVTLRPSNQIPNGRAKSGDRDFNRESSVTIKKMTISATTRLRMSALARAIR